MIIDSHAHAFPDELAPRAMEALVAELVEPITPCADGTVAGLLGRLDAAGIDASVVASIATKPRQFEPILAWSEAIRSDRIIPFCSVHPDDPEVLRHLDMIAERGFKGVKLHPYYQRFMLDEARLEPIYGRMAELGLILLCHTGFDIAFPRDRICDPARIAAVVEAHPDLTFIASHLGAWQDWDEVEAHLLGKPIYLDICFVHDYLGAERMRDMILRHPADHLLFASDSPWDDPGRVLGQVRAMELPPELEAKLLGENARRLLI